jgi:hypothetical protein
MSGIGDNKIQERKTSGLDRRTKGTEHLSIYINLAWAYTDSRR